MNDAKLKKFLGKQNISSYAPHSMLLELARGTVASNLHILSCKCHPIRTGLRSARNARLTITYLQVSSVAYSSDLPSKPASACCVNSGYSVYL
ncbi:Large ribosomal subunit protein [Trichinella spiralis]|uniref:Large ribosomal subunit protein n=1 Tax=Trichinella spiralis TaxID=6334 RepID=A0ABR3KRY7_TRISP